MEKSKELKNFAEELELTVLKEEEAVLLDVWLAHRVQIGSCVT